MKLEDLVVLDEGQDGGGENSLSNVLSLNVSTSHHPRSMTFSE
jgi:hypothetical protein